MSIYVYVNFLVPVNVQNFHVCLICVETKDKSNRRKKNKEYNPTLDEH